ncbi:hypothetical protein [Nocardia jejuensis]|uniref:hypothetical protein n=1 Tax=Nocardia jejuensis TaxID=328049 RepID=UPI000B051D7F|nr:hypothetical protein [Nocardia jejuensis]
MQIDVERARVLITVKTYPSPSDAYGETVCVAGVRLDQRSPTWIRLYPMKFRNAEAVMRFKKYDIVEVDVRKRDARDLRIESYRPDQRSLEVVGHMESDGRQWSARRALIGHLIGATSTCALIRANPAGAMGRPAPSLGLVKPFVEEMTISRGSPWTPQQQWKAEAASAPTLFDDEIDTLEPMPYRIAYRYRCTDPACRGHQQQCLDWEVGQAGREWLRKYGPDGVERRLRQKWEGQMCDPRRDLHFFIGNQARYRRSFEVLGTWYPNLPAGTDPDQLTLL